MIEIEKRYYLREITIKVNNRILTYDWDNAIAHYTYNGINKESFIIDHKKWDKVCTKYKIYPIFCKYEEISKWLAIKFNKK